jgi:hypothetical protein
VTTTAPHLVEPPNGEDLAKFLLARLAEDEAVAHVLVDSGLGAWLAKEEPRGAVTVYNENWRRIGVLDGQEPLPVMRHLLNNAPHYVGVDCRAKRAVVEMWVNARNRGDDEQEETLLPVLIQLAARYHQHEDFRTKAWRLW